MTLHYHDFQFYFFCEYFAPVCYFINTKTETRTYYNWHDLTGKSTYRNSQSMKFYKGTSNLNSQRAVSGHNKSLSDNISREKKMQIKE